MLIGIKWYLQVPPIIVHLLSSPNIRDSYSLKSVHGIYSGAAPLGVETIEGVHKIFPHWHVCQGYGTLHPRFRVLRVTDGSLAQV